MRILCVLWLLFSFLLGDALLVQDFISVRDSDGIVEVTDENYHQFSKGLRDFFSVVFVTSDSPNRNGELCEVCHAFESNLRKVSNAMLEQLPEEKANSVAFFKLDISRNDQFVEEFKISQLPICMVYPPRSESTENGEGFSWITSPFFQYQITGESIKQPLHFADFLAKRANFVISVPNNFEYDKFIKSFALYVIIFVIFKKKLLPLIASKTRFFVGLLSLAIIYISITGYQFTAMNHVVFLAANSEGDIMWFSGGMGYQFGIEILTVSAMYIAMATFFLLLLGIPKIGHLSNTQKNLLAIGICISLSYLYMYFVSCFKIKNPDYPYGLL